MKNEYSIKWNSSAFKYLNGLDKYIALRVLDKLDDLKMDPFRYLEHFEGKDFCKLRVGNFRLLIDADKDLKILYVRVFDKRGRIYKRK